MSQLMRSASSVGNGRYNVYDRLFNKRPSLNSVYNSSLSSSSEDYDNENNNYCNLYTYSSTNNNKIQLEAKNTNASDIIELYREPKRILPFENYDNIYELTQILTPKSIHINLVSNLIFIFKALFIG